MYNLIEDEDDIFTGSPRSKFLDVMFNANRDVAESELCKMVESLAVMEMILHEHYADDELEKKIRNYGFEKMDEIDMKSKSLYIELMGLVLSQSE